MAKKFRTPLEGQTLYTKDCLTSSFLLIYSKLHTLMPILPGTVPAVQTLKD